MVPYCFGFCWGEKGGGGVGEEEDGGHSNPETSTLACNKIKD